jgi:hypothetical protein
MATGTWPKQALMTCAVPWCRHRQMVSSYSDAVAKGLAHHWKTHPRRMLGARGLT